MPSPSPRTSTSRSGTPASGRARWLTEEEQEAWRGLQQMQALLSATLNRHLADAGLSLQDYAVLVALTERPDGRMRPVDLGRALGWEKSRLSHHASRMVERGLVARQSCPTDRRGWLLAITEQGRAAIETAAPDHVAAVRRFFVDRLTRSQLVALTKISRTVLDGLEAECAAAVEE